MINKRIIESEFFCKIKWYIIIEYIIYKIMGQDMAIMGKLS